MYIDKIEHQKNRWETRDNGFPLEIHSFETSGTKGMHDLAIQPHVVHWLNGTKETQGMPGICCASVLIN